jgi:hypothetical protein
VNARMENDDHLPASLQDLQRLLGTFGMLGWRIALTFQTNWTNLRPARGDVPQTLLRGC